MVFALGAMPTSRREFRTRKRQCRQRADEGIGPHAKGYHYCAQGWTLRRARCPHRAANFGRGNDSAGSGPMRASAPTQKGIIIAPRVGLCVGRDGYSAAVGGSAALRMRHTPCGCIAPRIPDAETTVPQRADEGIGPYAKTGVRGEQRCKQRRGRVTPPHTGNGRGVSGGMAALIFGYTLYIHFQNGENFIKKLKIC